MHFRLHCIPSHPADQEVKGLLPNWANVPCARVTNCRYALAVKRLHFKLFQDTRCKPLTPGTPSFTPLLLILPVE
jgi:hypothetical protein